MLEMRPLDLDFDTGGKPSLANDTFDKNDIFGVSRCSSLRVLCLAESVATPAPAMVSIMSILNHDQFARTYPSCLEVR